MANCPNCGSSHITLTKEANVNWGRAAVGWALFGVVGGAVGAVTGEDRNINVCLDCGTPWKASDLHKICQIIETSTGVTLNLASEKDRLYMSSFMTQVAPYIKAIADVDKKAENLVKLTKNKSEEQAATGCASGCVISFIGFFALASVISSGGSIILILVPPLVGYGIGSLMDRVKKQSVEREVKAAMIEAHKMKHEASENFNFILREFMYKHPS